MLVHPLLATATPSLVLRVQSPENGNEPPNRPGTASTILTAPPTSWKSAMGIAAAQQGRKNLKAARISWDDPGNYRKGVPSPARRPIASPAPGLVGLSEVSGLLPFTPGARSHSSSASAAPGLSRSRRRGAGTARGG